MFFFINHHAKKIVLCKDSNAALNISKNLFQAIRDNKWSIGDHIELIDLMTYDKYKTRKLIEDEHYESNDAHWFYF